MPEHRALTAEQRLADLRRGRARVRRERMAREVAGPVWKRMRGIVPLLFRFEGRIVARVLISPREDVIRALREDAVFAGDTAMRLAHGAGFLTGGDVHAYVMSADPLDRLADAGAIEAEPCPPARIPRLCARGPGHPGCSPSSSRSYHPAARRRMAIAS
jgi:hypothetical protein